MPITDFVETRIDAASPFPDNEWIEVKAWVSESYPLLAVTGGITEGDKALCITHIPTGYAVFFGDDNLEAMKSLLERIYDLADWTLPRNDIGKDLRENLGGESPYDRLTDMHFQIKHGQTAKGD